jgi:hypothetical protein
MPTPSESPAAAWWRRHGEPAAITALLLAAMSLAPLLALGLLTPAQARAAAIVLAWAVACLLLLRLPALLRAEGRRRLALAVAAAALLAALLAPAAPRPAVAQSGLQIQAPPRISRAAFTQILSRAGSPAAPHGDELYAIIVGYGLDPAVALAFFQHESQFCTVGRCARAELRNWGMLRRPIRASRGAGSGEGFARYASFQDGLRDWCELMLGYIGRGMETVEEAIPRYAPQSDGNVPTAYISAIRRQVAAWSGAVGDDPTLRAYDAPLDTALVTETFLASDQTYHPTWAFHTFMLAEGRAGRPLGAPLAESRVISVGGQRFAVQVFALDTLYTPLAAVEAETNWGDVRRMSTLLRVAPAPTSTP